MELYLRLISIVFLFTFFVSLIVWMVFRRFNQRYKIFRMKNISLGTEELSSHAAEIAIEHAVSKKGNISTWPIPRMKDNYDYIYELYSRLTEDIKIKGMISSSAEWLLDNFYIIDEIVDEVKKEIDKKSYSKLPVIKSGEFKGYSRVFALANEIIAHTDGKIDENVLTEYINAYQTNKVLFAREIWAIPVMLKIAYIEYIRQICEAIRESQYQWHKADIIVEKWLENNENIKDLMKNIKKNIQSSLEVNPSFIEHLIFLLRKSGMSYGKVLSAVDVYISMLGTTIENVVSEEHNKQSIYAVSMKNSIISIRHLMSFEWKFFLKK